MKRKILATLAAGSIAVLTSMSAGAVDISFFAQDLGAGENTPLSSWANSSAAEADFLSYLVGVGTETFEGASGSAPIALTFPGAGTATLQGSADVITGFQGFGRYPISGQKWVETTTGFNILFSDAVAAFGFYGVDVGDFGGDLTLNFVDGTTRTFALDEVAGTPGGTVMFFGYINDENPFTSVTFGNTAGGVDYFGFDNMTIGSVEQVSPPSVPDSGATLGLLCFALLGLTTANRKLRAA